MSPPYDPTTPPVGTPTDGASTDSPGGGSDGGGIARRALIGTAALAVTGFAGYKIYDLLVPPSAPPREPPPNVLTATQVEPTVEGTRVLLSFAEYPDLAAPLRPYSVKLPRFDEQYVLVWRLDAPVPAFRAVRQQCTHSGCRVALLADEPGFHCKCHNSRFAGDGSPAAGPAREPLADVAVEVSDDGVAFDVTPVVRT